MSVQRQYPTEFPQQHQEINPGVQTEVTPSPMCDNPNYKGSQKLKDMVAIITGGDSGIGRAVAIFYAREGAKVAVVYLENHKDAEDTKRLVEKEGSQCLLIPGDVRSKQFCLDVAQKTVQAFGKIDILVNHAGIQYAVEKLEDISEEQLDNVFKTNVYSYFFMIQAVLPHMREGSSIINTSSVNAYKGNARLLDYTSSKGANRSFTYALSLHLGPRKIRVNAVAPGPIWTPFIPPSFPEEKIPSFGQQTLLKRAGQPEECAPAYVFLASPVDSSYITGQTIHVNGGMSTDS